MDVQDGYPYTNLTLSRSTHLYGFGDDAMWDDEEIIRVSPTYYRVKEDYDKAVKRFISDLHEDMDRYAWRRWQQLMFRWNSRSESNDYNCQQCKSEWELGPVVIDSLWRAITGFYLTNLRLMLCRTCMEQAIGRGIERAEEQDVLWNSWRRRVVND